MRLAFCWTCFGLHGVLGVPGILFILGMLIPRARPGGLSGQHQQALNRLSAKSLSNAIWFFQITRPFGGHASITTLLAHISCGLALEMRITIAY